MRAWIACAGMAVAGAADAKPAAKPAAVKLEARDKLRLAEQLGNRGDYDQALAAVEQGLAIAPGNVALLGLKGAVLLKLRNYAGALAAYQAYLAAGATGGNRHQAEKIVDDLRAVQSTFLEIALASGPAAIYLDSKTLGVFCTAAPTCNVALLPGDYKVIAERPGFERWSGPVTVEPNRTTRVAVALIEKPSQLTVRVAQPGARITVDGAPYDPAAPITGGAHEVVVVLPGHTDARRTITAHDGAPVELDVALAPIVVRAPPPAAPPSRFTLRRRIALGVGGAGVAAAATGAVFGMQSSARQADARRSCPANPCVDAPAANARLAAAESRALAANISFAVAGGAAIAAAVLWFTGAPESSVVVSPRVGPVAGLDLIFTY